MLMWACAQCCYDHGMLSTLHLLMQLKITSAMKIWVLLLWLLLLHPISDAETCQEKGDIRLRGRDGENLKAGRIEICNGTVWRVVCGGDWDMMDANVVCRQLGFPEGGEEYFSFGQENNGGLNTWGCLGNEMKLINCTHTISNECSFAGVACRTTITVTPSLATCTVLGRTLQDNMASTIGLGVMVALLALGLVCMVIWNVYLHMKKRISINMRTSAFNSIVNPTSSSGVINPASNDPNSTSTVSQPYHPTTLPIIRTPSLRSSLSSST